MINWDKIGKKVSLKILAIFMSIILIIILIMYYLILHKNLQSNSFAESVISISEKNENPVFSIEKIYLCSSANAVDDNLQQNLNSLDVYQYTDIAIYIKNTNSSEELTNENTIKELYIDNISIETNSNLGEQSIEYANIFEAGNGNYLNNNSSNERIDFNIIYTNKQNQIANYDEPTFYTDCSNPITLRYMNKNLYTDYIVEKDNSISFDGSLLEKIGVSIEDINCKIKFKINIINNNDEYYSCWLSFSIPLDEIYQGTSIKSANITGTKYNFFTL